MRHNQWYFKSEGLQKCTAADWDPTGRNHTWWYGEKWVLISRYVQTKRISLHFRIHRFPTEGQKLVLSLSKFSPIKNCLIGKRLMQEMKQVMLQKFLFWDPDSYRLTNVSEFLVQHDSNNRNKVKCFWMEKVPNVKNCPLRPRRGTGFE